MKLILNYIKNNKFTCILITIFFIIGIITGCLATFKTTESDKEEIKFYIEETITILTENRENKQEIFLNTFISNTKFTLIIWLLGCTVIAGFVIYLLIAYKGFLIGYISAIIIKIFGLKLGVIYLCILMLIQNIIIIPLWFLLGISGLGLYKNIIKNKYELKYEFIRHIIILGITIGFVIIASCVEAYVLLFFLYS